MKPKAACRNYLLQLRKAKGRKLEILKLEAKVEFLFFKIVS